MTESELYKKLGKLTKNRDEWETNIPFVSSLLTSDSIKIKAKALWLLGEMGLAFPSSIEKYIHAIASYCSSEEPLLRERAVNAPGRIGRVNFHAIEVYWENMFRFALDEAENVRLSFIWASENIATNNPDLYEKYLPLFAHLLNDPADRVRMEVPEIFRVLGKRRPEFIKPYIEQLRMISETDEKTVLSEFIVWAQ